MPTAHSLRRTTWRALPETSLSWWVWANWTVILGKKDWHKCDP
ncbi:hypothetical protein E2C01_030714 [Portunus trituberculatus]|uniref:Uncharacterized protein n=1 Tax=Portunus trituberculatus TaxID=210409 RepID=A0A5B7ER58_PORTR|nr:hypothetical protein [Portunus trituberculatus]